MCGLIELDMLTNKFVALEQDNQTLLGDLHQVSAKKVQKYAELSQRAHELDITMLQRQATEIQTPHTEQKIRFPTKFDGTRSQFSGLLNHVRLVIQLHPICYPTNVACVELAVLY